MDTPLKYVAEVSHVREVSLLGAANLAYWRDHLAKQDLTPAEQGGHAQLLIVAAEMRFMGVRFRELSFSVLVECGDMRLLPLTPALSPGGRGRNEIPHAAGPHDTAPHDAGLHAAAAPHGTAGGAYLVQAFNSCRFFAFCERVFFSTPYHHGDVRVATALPASVRLIQGGETVFAAEMQHDPAAPTREPSRVGEDGWQGPVFLPPRGRRDDARGKWFFARIQGQTRTYPFVHPADRVTIKPGPHGEIFQALLDSQFTATEWAIREDATHAKSKTAARDGL